MRSRLTTLRLRRRRYADVSSRRAATLAGVVALSLAVVTIGAAAAPAAAGSTERGPAAVPATLAAPAVATAQPLAHPATGRATLRLLFGVGIALGLILVLASALPLHAVRPPIVYEIVLLHRLDLALFGGSLLVLVAALYLVSG